MTFVYRSNGAFLRACEKFIAFRFDHALRLVCRFSFLISPHFVLPIITASETTLPSPSSGAGRVVGIEGGGSRSGTATKGRNGGQRRRAETTGGGQADGGQTVGRQGGQARRQADGGQRAVGRQGGRQTAGRGNGRRQQERRENGRQRRQGGRKSDFGKPGFFRIFTE